MSKKRGHIKWFRDILDNPLFRKKPWSDWQAFEFLCLQSKRFPGDLILTDGTVMHLDTGQVFISRATFADIAGWSTKKLRAWEKRVNTLKMVTVSGTPWGMVYTVENYTFHQHEGQAKGQGLGQSKGQTEGQRKKKDKESIKKETRFGDEKAPNGSEKNVIPMPEEIRRKLDKAIKEV